jgi:hypothetical protein
MMGGVAGSQALRGPHRKGVLLDKLLSKLELVLG